MADITDNALLQPYIVESIVCCMYVINHVRMGVLLDKTWICWKALATGQVLLLQMDLDFFKSAGLAKFDFCTVKMELDLKWGST